MAFAFEKLLVYQKAVDFADRICFRRSDPEQKTSHVAMDSRSIN